MWPLVLAKLIYPRVKNELNPVKGKLKQIHV